MLTGYFAQYFKNKNMIHLSFGFYFIVACICQEVLQSVMFVGWFVCSLFINIWPLAAMRDA